LIAVGLIWTDYRINNALLLVVGAGTDNQQQGKSLSGLVKSRGNEDFLRCGRYNPSWVPHFLKVRQHD
jgi:hypothetical protein